MLISRLIWLLPLILPALQIQDGGTTPDGSPSGQLEELDRIVFMVTSERNDPETRRFGAELLLRDNKPSHIEAAIRILSGKAESGGAFYLCEVLARLNQTPSSPPDPRMVDPLLALLGNADDRLSVAAAAALNTFRSGMVSEKLGALAGNTEKPMRQRLAAIDALALATDSKATVQQLIDLIRSGDGRIVEQVVRSLRPAARVDYGFDANAWEAWWRKKSAMTQEDWLRDRLDLADEKNAAMSLEIQRLRQEGQARDKLVAQRLGDLLTTIYQLTPQQAQKDAKLQQWLSDQVAEFRLFALQIVRTQIVEGNPPGPEIRDSVKKLFSDPSAAVRIEALGISGALRDPADAEMVLSLFSTERDSEVRATMARVLGRLDNPLAIPVLVEILNNSKTPPGLIRETARSIGILGASGRVDTETIVPAIAPLANRLSDLPPEEVSVREALLGAMAMIGDHSFKTSFVDHLLAAEPELVLAAIRGIRVLGATDQMDRLLNLLTHVDPRVRQLSAEAVGALGTESNLEAMFNRLSAAVESNDGVRQAAWDAFQALLSRSTPASKLQWADRMERMPDKKLLLLRTMVDDWTTNGAPPPELILAREKLAEVQLANGNFAEAATHFQAVVEHYAAVDPQRATKNATSLVKAILQVPDRSQFATAFLAAMDKVDEPTRNVLSGLVFDTVGQLWQSGDEGAAKKLVTVLSGLPMDRLGGNWVAGLNPYLLRAGMEPLEAATNSESETHTP